MQAPGGSARFSWPLWARRNIRGGPGGTDSHLSTSFEVQDGPFRCSRPQLRPRSSAARAGATRPRTWTSRSPVVQLDRAALADPGEQLPRRVRQSDVDVLPERGEERRQLDAAACRARTRSAPRRAPCPPTAGRLPCPAGRGRREQVRLVVGDEARLVAGAELVEHRLDGARGAPAAWASAASTTSTSTSARFTSSSVARNASTSWCGSLWMKPTVSVRIALWPSPSFTWRDVGIEGREELVLGERDLAADERVEERGLAGVRVADDADGRHAAAGRGLAPPSRAPGGRRRRAPSSS